MGGQLRILQIGAGSMGKRRLRDLVRREDVELALYEIRQDRRDAVAAAIGVRTFAELDEAMAWRPQALVISTPPDQHTQYIDLAIEFGIHHFCEAHIWTPEPNRIALVSRQKGLISASSCSFHFLPAVAALRRIVTDELGELYTYQMALNTYANDWHPGEGDEFYARHRNTAAGREMVPFELLWLNEVFGSPRRVAGTVSRCARMPQYPEDTWCLQMELDNGAVGQLMVLMGSPGQLRQGWCFGARGQVHFDLISGQISRQYRDQGVNDRLCLGAQREVLERTYADEISAFVDAIQGRAPWPNSYAASAVATATLAAAERSAAVGTAQPVVIERQPQELPALAESVGSGQPS